MITLISFIITLVGSLNWLLVGLFKLDLVATIFGSQESLASRIIYIIVGVSSIWLVIQAARQRGKLNIKQDNFKGSEGTDSLLKK